MIHHECIREEENEPPYPESVAAAHILGEHVTIGGDLVLPEHRGLRDAAGDMPRTEPAVQAAPFVEEQRKLAPTEVALPISVADLSTTREPHADRGAKLRLEAPKNAPPSSSPGAN